MVIVEKCHGKNLGEKRAYDAVRVEYEVRLGLSELYKDEPYHAKNIDWNNHRSVFIYSY